MTGPLFDQCLQYAVVLGSATAAIKLYYCGLHRLYPFFFLYLVLHIPNTIWPLFLSRTSYTYQKVWIVTDPVFLILYVMLVIELYRLVLNKYRGLYTLGRWAVYGISAISVAISAISLIPKLTPELPQSTKVMGYVFALERGVNTSLAIFLILLLLFLSLFPIKLSRNVRVHALVYPLFFLSNTFALLLRGLWGLKRATELNIAMLAVSVVALATWTLLLSPAGEEVPGVISPMPKAYEQRLLERLNSLNATLLRARH
jgi:hypothetical protein